MLQQDEDLADPHALCGEIALPGAGFDEHRRPDVHEEVWGDGAIGGLSSLPLEARYPSLCIYSQSLWPIRPS